MLQPPLSCYVGGPLLFGAPRQLMRFRYVLAALISAALGSSSAAVEPVNVGFLWHMHQPLYYPGETITQTDAAGHFSFNITDVHNQRLGPYTTWPRDAIQSGLALPHLGAQVSFSGSLIQNLNELEAAGVNGGQWNNWEAAYKQAAQWDTSLGNPRLDLVNFGFNHPLMPLLDMRDMRMQIKLRETDPRADVGPGRANFERLLSARNGLFGANHSRPRGRGDRLVDGRQHPLGTCHGRISVHQRLEPLSAESRGPDQSRPRDQRRPWVQLQQPVGAEQSRGARSRTARITCSTSTQPPAQ